MSTLRKAELLGASLLAGLLFTTPSWAQEAQDEEAAEQPETIVVTGSRIRTTEANAPQPLIQVTGEDLIVSGEANIIDALADIPALQGSIVPEDTTGAGLGDGGLSLLNLRDLGAARSLTLVDGRRHVGASAGQQSVDVDTIPRLLIEDVQIITGANSAVYGADAVSGVTNFILRDDFEGLIVDSAFAEINQSGQTNFRVSGLAGRNWELPRGLRLNTWASAEFEESESVFITDTDLEFTTRTLTGNDADPAGSPDDGIPDVAVLEGFGSISRIPGGTLILGHDVRQNGFVDGVNIPFSACTGPTSGACFVADPGFAFGFAPGGERFPIDFGTARDQTGLDRLLVAGSTTQVNSFLDNGNILPEARARRFQSGFTLEKDATWLGDIEIFGDAKFVEEQTIDDFQPFFQDITIGDFGGAPPGIAGSGLFSLTTSGLDITDNAFIDPALRDLILNNQIALFDQPGADGIPTGETAPFPFAQMDIFAFDFGFRPQNAERETLRGVLGVRGDVEKLWIAENLSWEIGGTWGQAQQDNFEFQTIDLQRFNNAIDAVVDTAGVVNGNPGEIVCRVQVLAAQGQPLGGFNDGDPGAASECVPVNLFGGPGALTPAFDFVTTTQQLSSTNRQSNVLGFVTGELPNPLAGTFLNSEPVGFSFGGEYRKERTFGTFTPPQDGSGIFFANALSSQPDSQFDVFEGFFEVNIPLIRDVRFARRFDIGGAYRFSDYSTIGGTSTWNANGIWTPFEGFTIRGTVGRAVRAPNLDELFGPTNQTFIQITDPCSQPVINATTDPTVQANRIQNCAALGVPSSFVDPNPGTSNSGFNGANPLLSEEVSDSYTLSGIFEPTFLEGFTFVVDYFNIEITDAIANLTAQTIVNQCTDNDQLNTAFCGLFSRDPSTFEIVDFIQGPVNFAAFEVEGIDFVARYGKELDEVHPSLFGRLDTSINGTYQLRRENFTNINDPEDATELDGNLNFPRVRFSLRSSFTEDYKFFGVDGQVSLIHTWDWQASQERLEGSFFRQQSDTGQEAFAETGSFGQHDFTVTFRTEDAINFRGGADLEIRGGVINAFDNEPEFFVGQADIFDLFGRRLFVGLRLSY